MSGSDHWPDHKKQYERSSSHLRWHMHATKQQAELTPLGRTDEPMLGMSIPDPDARPRAARTLRWEVTVNIKWSARELTAALLAMLLIGGLCGRARADVAVSACGTLSTPATNYFLTQNLTATGNCLVIAADNVGIDLKGKTITGNGSGSGITDGGFAHPFAIIANGKIRNFKNGVDLVISGEAIVSNLDSSKNTGDGIFISECCNTLNSFTANNKPHT